MRNKKLLLVFIGIVLLVLLAGLFYRQEKIVEPMPLNASYEYCVDPVLKIGISPTSDSPNGICKGDIAGTAYGWPSPVVAVANWKYPADQSQGFAEGAPTKTAYRWRFYPAGLIADLSVGVLVASPFLYHKYKSIKK